MAIVDGVWRVPFPVGHVHLVRLRTGFAVVDTGVPGSAPEILDALRHVGGAPEDLRQIVLTHSHVDHMGAAADLVDATEAQVLAGAADAPAVGGVSAEPEAVLTGDPERKLWDQVRRGMAAADPKPLRYVPVGVRLDDGDALEDWPGGARVVHAPGHTPGSIGIYLDAHGLLFSGDTVATGEGRALLGPFNADREQAERSFHRLAALEPDILCVPHGDPIIGGAARALAAATPEHDWR